MKVREKYRTRLTYGPGTFACVETNDGHFLGLSRYDNEKDWVIDSHFGTSGYPYFANGRGSRCTYLKVATAKLAALIDAAPTADDPVAVGSTRE